MVYHFSWWLFILGGNTRMRPTDYLKLRHLLLSLPVMLEVFSSFSLFAISSVSSMIFAFMVSGRNSWQWKTRESDFGSIGFPSRSFLVLKWSLQGGYRLLGIHNHYSLRRLRKSDEPRLRKEQRSNTHVHDASSPPSEKETREIDTVTTKQIVHL